MRIALPALALCVASSASCALPDRPLLNRPVMNPGAQKVREVTAITEEENCVSAGDFEVWDGGSEYLEPGTRIGAVVKAKNQALAMNANTIRIDHEQPPGAATDGRTANHYILRGVAFRCSAPQG